ncbi:hypothetical protein ACH518_09540 [Methylomonas sp. HW2-6]|uniref:hypothetical protein n=1 Tax=Methylomonas sp. HW2-6 TaxID=3376687 RepID=UPI004043801B
MNIDLKWYEVLGGLVIGIAAIAYMATKEQADYLPTTAPATQLASQPDATSTPVPDGYPYGVDQTDPDNFGQVMQLALRGNYQAQRNIAYGFAAQPYHGQQKNPVLACAWYLVVLNSGSKHLGIGDASNAEIYCGKLEPDLLETAKQHASHFAAEIAENTKFGKLD